MFNKFPRFISMPKNSLGFHSCYLIYLLLFGGLLCHSLFAISHIFNVHFHILNWKSLTCLYSRPRLYGGKPAISFRSAYVLVSVFIVATTVTMVRTTQQTTVALFIYIESSSVSTLNLFVVPDQLVTEHIV